MRPVPGEEEERITGSISVTGRDRRGVVARITQFLFEEDANIESLEEQVTRGRFDMNLLASWRLDRMDEDGREALRERLAAVGREVGMDARIRFHVEGAARRMAILVTKEPHCLEALLKATGDGSLNAETVVVIGNRDDLRPLAEAAGVPFVHVPWTDRPKAEETLVEVLDRYDVDFLVLARFMRILSPGFCWRYRNRIINIHPSLLPAFAGAEAYRQAWEKGVRVVGVTAHFVTPDLDQGPIIHQDAFGVGADWSVKKIREKGQEFEAKVLVEAVRVYLEKRLDVHWGRVWTD